VAVEKDALSPDNFLTFFVCNNWVYSTCGAFLALLRRNHFLQRKRFGLLPYIFRRTAWSVCRLSHLCILLKPFYTEAHDILHDTKTHSVRWVSWPLDGRKSFGSNLAAKTCNCKLLLYTLDEYTNKQFRLLPNYFC